MEKPYFVLLQFDADDREWYEAGSSHYSLDQVRADSKYQDDGEPMRVLKIFDERNFSAVLSRAKIILNTYGKTPPHNNFSVDIFVNGLTKCGEVFRV